MIRPGISLRPFTSECGPIISVALPACQPTYPLCLDYVLIFGRQRVLGAYADHYNRARPHRGLDLEPPDPRLPVERVPGTIVCRRDALGGLIPGYHREHGVTVSTFWSPTGDPKLTLRENEVLSHVAFEKGLHRFPEAPSPRDDADPSGRPGESGSDDPDERNEPRG